MADLLDALQANFEGHESLRQTLLNGRPSTATTTPTPTSIAREAQPLLDRRGVQATSRPPASATGRGYLSWNYWIAYAPTTAATPDGRRRGQFLSNGVCPVNGADRKGPTAVIKSVGKLGLETAPNGGSATP